ncbi:hypothetical protein [Enterococcus malodoratus]|uniref:hypothetical protein n=1 Tax=Enterococcus malodoratus TaxID=71451 RepID=UPI0022E956C5|nr:hypothetical protein [Enterococcus malodoratus]
MKETDMFEPVKLLLEELGCSNVYGEIMNFDVVGLRGCADVIVEMKKTLNFKVIEQAYHATQWGHFVYIAVPKVKTSHWFIYHEFLSPKNIGLIYVSENKTSEKLWGKYHDEPYPKYIASVAYDAKFNHNAPKKRLKGKFEQYGLRGHIKAYAHKNIGGSKGGETITDYSFMISAVKEYLKQNGSATLDEIIKNVPIVSEHYKNPKASLRATFREKWNEHWLKMTRDFEKKEIIYELKSEEAEKIS